MMLLHLCLRSMSKFIFVYGVSLELKFIFYIDYPVHCLLKRLTESLDAVVENQLTTYVWFYFWTLYSVSLICLPSHEAVF